MSAIDPLDVQRLGWTLLHFVWQGAALALVLATLLLLLRSASARARYLLAAATLGLMTAAPVVTFAVLRGHARGAGREAEPPAVVAAPNAAEAAQRVRLARPAYGARLRETVDGVLPAVVALWAAGVVLLSMRALGGFVLVQRLRRAGLASAPLPLSEAVERLRQALAVSRAVRVFESALVQVPTVVGWLRPVVLVPASALSGLTPQQIELILAHELAHVRRADYLVNLLQAVVETILFYHPAVWWVSHRMRVEREHCCDDLAVGACGSPLRYARALHDLGRLCAEAPALAMAASGGSLAERVARLVVPPRPLSRASRGVASLVVLTGFGLAAVTASSLGTTQAARPQATAAIAQAAPPAAPAEEAATEECCAEEPEPRADEPVPAEAEASIDESACCEDWDAIPPPPPAVPPLPAVAPVPPPAARPARPAPPPPPTPVLSARVPAPPVPALAPAPAWPDPPDVPPVPPARIARAETKRARPSGDPAARAFPIERILELARAGVTPEYVEAMDAAGLGELTPEQLVTLRSHGVSPEYLREMREAGYPDLKVDQLVELRSHGVSAGFARGLRAEGLESLSLADLVSLRSHGVSAGFVRDLKKAGFEGLSVSKLIMLRSQGISGRYLEEMKALGYSELSSAKVVALRSAGVEPDWVRGLRELGYDELDVGQLLALRAQGVTPEYARGLREAGFLDLKTGDLLALRAAGVTPEFAREVKDAGFDTLTPAELVELRQQGVSPALLKRLRGRR
jgi:beta-lactamase regulating signal transducer with metallopeptidase domain